MMAKKLITVGGKLGIFGGVIYYFTYNGLFSDNAEYSSVKALQDIGQKADKTIGRNYISQIKVPSVKFNASEKWNYGIEKSINFAADLPKNVSSTCSNGVKYIAEKFK